MQKIKAVGVAINTEGTLFVTDELGQLWMRAELNQQWSQVELPEQPDGEWNNNGGLGILPERER